MSRFVSLHRILFRLRCCVKKCWVSQARKGFHGVRLCRSCPYLHQWCVSCMRVRNVALVVGLALAGEASTSFLCRVYILQLLSVTGWAIEVRPCLGWGGHDVAAWWAVVRHGMVPFRSLPVGTAMAKWRSCCQASKWREWWASRWWLPLRWYAKSHQWWTRRRSRWHNWCSLWSLWPARRWSDQAGWVFIALSEPETGMRRSAPEKVLLCTE